jgi:hypothetical protein
MPSFRVWLEARLPEVPNAMSVALRIIQGGKAGASSRRRRIPGQPDATRADEACGHALHDEQGGQPATE